MSLFPKKWSVPLRLRFNKIKSTTSAPCLKTAPCLQKLKCDAKSLMHDSLTKEPKYISIKSKSTFKAVHVSCYSLRCSHLLLNQFGGRFVGFNDHELSCVDLNDVITPSI